MKQDLAIPESQAGELWHHRFSRNTRAEHRHDELEFNLVLQGTATYLVGDRQYRVRRHSLAWLFPGQEHLLFGESPDFAMWIGVVRPDEVQRVCTQPWSIPLTEMRPDGDYFRVIDGKRGVRLHEVLADLAEVRKDVDTFNAGLTYAMLTAWNAFLDAGLQPPVSTIHPAVESAAQVLAQNEDTYRIEEVALAACLSQSRLRYLFKEQMGVTLTDFRSRIRIKRFQTLYDSQPNTSMVHAALDAGFGSYAQFHRVFKKVMGYGPAEYRRSRDRKVE